MSLSKEDTNSITVLNERYLFSMRKIGTTETSRSLHVDFSPILEKYSMLNHRTSGKSANVFPAYNFDKKPHTPSFILPIDIVQYFLSRPNTRCMKINIYIYITKRFNKFLKKKMRLYLFLLCLVCSQTFQEK